MSKHDGLKRWVGQYAETKESLPCVQPGERVPACTTVIIKELVGDQHFNVSWTSGLPAAENVHFSKLCRPGI